MVSYDKEDVVENVKIQKQTFFNELLKEDSSHHFEFLAHNYDETYNGIFFFYHK